MHDLNQVWHTLINWLFSYTQTESYNLTLEAISALNATTEVVLEIQNQMVYGITLTIIVVNEQ